MTIHHQQQDLARATYEEAVRVTEAYQIQLQRRKTAVHSDETERVARIEEARHQLEAAERREYEAWQQLNHLRQMAVRQPWVTV